MGRPDVERQVITALEELADFQGNAFDGEEALIPVCVSPATVCDEQREEIVVAAEARTVGFGPTFDPYATVACNLDEMMSHGSRFRILRRHARGGLGEVFVAEDGELHREVAVKQIQFRHADDDDARARFLLEAEITGRLEHPGIVPVYGLGTYADGRPYYAMRFIHGESLQEATVRYHDCRRRLDDAARGLELRKLLRSFVDVCNTVAYAHSRSVLHRDLKPANVMLGKYGETLVVDWGLAKALGAKANEPSADRERKSSREPGASASGSFDGETPLEPSSSGGSIPTVHGAAVGTPGYMSPEQSAGRLDELTPASDVYGLGATLYHMLTGRAPFVGDDLGDLLRRIQRGEFPSPRELDPAVPKSLEAVCLKAMALRPSDRYPSARALADDVEQWLADEPVTAGRETHWERAQRWGRKHRTAVDMGIAALVVVTGVALAGAVAIRNAHQGELFARRQAEAGADEARRQRNLAQANAEEAEKQRQTAEVVARIADRQHDLALDAIEDMCFDVLETVPDGPAFASVKRKILETARAKLTAVSEPLSGDDPRCDRLAAATLLLTADLHAAEGQSARAEEIYLDALATLTHLTQREPTCRQAQDDLAMTFERLGEVALGRREAATARSRFEQCLAIRRRLAEAAPQDAEAVRELALAQDRLDALQVPAQTR